MRLILDGVAVDGCRSVEITNPRSSRAASFRIHASSNEITRILGRGWVDADQLDVAVEFGMLPPGAREGQGSRMKGFVPNLDYENGDHEVSSLRM